MAIGGNMKRKKGRKLIPESSLEQNQSQEVKKNYEVILSPSKRKSVRKIMITLKGELVLKNVEEIKREVLSAFDDYDFMDFKLSEVKEFDFGCIQLLHYIKKSWSDKGKTVTIDSDFPDNIRYLIEAAGYKSLLIKPKLT